MLTPLTNSVLTGLFDEAAVEAAVVAAVVATGATIGVDVDWNSTVEPNLLVVDLADVSLEKVTTAADVSLEKVTTAADEVWIEAGPIREE